MDFIMQCVHEISSLNDELEFALDNLSMVHNAMEEDGGANWQRSNNAVFSVYLQLNSICKQLNEVTESAIMGHAERKKK